MGDFLFQRLCTDVEKKGSSGLSTRPLIPCVGSQISSLQLELDVCWASKLFWMQHTSKEINYVNYVNFVNYVNSHVL